jgi:hypothetical protein
MSEGAPKSGQGWSGSTGCQLSRFLFLERDGSQSSPLALSLSPTIYVNKGEKSRHSEIWTPAGAVFIPPNQLHMKSDSGTVI